MSSHAPSIALTKPFDDAPNNVVHHFLQPPVSGTVLIVENDVDLRATIETVLRYYYFGVTNVQNGQETIEHLHVVYRKC